MTIRHALFIEEAWADAGANAWSALVTVDQMGIEIKPYIDAEVCDVLRLSFEEFAAIAEMVDRVRNQEQEPRP